MASPTVQAILAYQKLTSLTGAAAAAYFNSLNNGLKWAVTARIDRHYDIRGQWYERHCHLFNSLEE